jgi:CheY-like chemotaxis protein
MDAADTVRDAGFEAIEATNAAIAIIDANHNIHVVFTDVQMPGTTDGLKLARFIKDRWPPIKIVATSVCLRMSEKDLPESSVFVPKPYSPASRIDRQCMIGRSFQLGRMRFSKMLQNRPLTVRSPPV